MFTIEDLNQFMQTFSSIPEYSAIIFSAAHFTIAVSYAMTYFSVTRNNSAEFIFTTFISCEKLEKLYNNVTGSSFRFRFFDDYWQQFYNNLRKLSENCFFFIIGQMPAKVITL